MVLLRAMALCRRFHLCTNALDTNRQPEKFGGVEMSTGDPGHPVSGSDTVRV